MNTQTTDAKVPRKTRYQTVRSGRVFRTILFYTIFFGTGPLLMRTVGPCVGIPIGAFIIIYSVRLLEPKRKKRKYA